MKILAPQTLLMTWTYHHNLIWGQHGIATKMVKYFGIATMQYGTRTQDRTCWLVANVVTLVSARLILDQTFLAIVSSRDVSCCIAWQLVKLYRQMCRQMCQRLLCPLVDLFPLRISQEKRLQSSSQAFLATRLQASKVRHTPQHSWVSQFCQMLISGQIPQVSLNWGEPIICGIKPRWNCSEQNSLAPQKNFYIFMLKFSDRLLHVLLVELNN